jgi:protein gp37
MGKDTGIQWTDDTVNSTSGCDGCELWVPGKGGPCYAGNFQTDRLSKSLPLLYAKDFTEVRLIPGRMAKAAAASDLTGKDRPGKNGENAKPWLNGMPRCIFVGDMGDIFSKDVPFAYLKAELIDIANSEHGRRHIWQVLTKRPSRMAEFSRWLESLGETWPKNVWVGTSVTGMKSVGRVDHLKKVGNENTVRFISAEPLFEAVDFSAHLRKAKCIHVKLDIAGAIKNKSFAGFSDDQGKFLTRQQAEAELMAMQAKGIKYMSMGDCQGFDPQVGCPGHTVPSVDWIIVGGMSGTNPAPFNIEWARDIRDQCKAAGLACFIKQPGAKPGDAGNADAFKPLRDSHGGDMGEWPEDLRVRQMPAWKVA